jgi:hypothetical protein
MALLFSLIVRISCQTLLRTRCILRISLQTYCTSTSLWNKLLTSCILYKWQLIQPEKKLVAVNGIPCNIGHYRKLEFTAKRSSARIHACNYFLQPTGHSLNQVTKDRGQTCSRGVRNLELPRDIFYRSDSCISAELFFRFKALCKWLPIHKRVNKIKIMESGQQRRDPDWLSHSCTHAFIIFVSHLKIRSNGRDGGVSRFLSFRGEKPSKEVDGRLVCRGIRTSKTPQATINATHFVGYVDFGFFSLSLSIRDNWWWCRFVII